MKNVEGFVSKWLVIAFFMMYHRILFKNQVIDFDMLTVILVCSLAGCVVWELIKDAVRKL